VTGHRTAAQVKRSVLPYRSRNGHLLLVDVRVTNGTSRSVDLIAPWSLDSGGQSYLPVAACDIGLANGMSGALEANAGQTVSGTVCFDVPTQVSGGSLSLVPRSGAGPAARVRL